MLVFTYIIKSPCKQNAPEAPERMIKLKPFAYFKTKEVIRSLLGLKLELLDDSLLEEIRFGPDHGVLIFGEKKGIYTTVAGPAFDYKITLTGKAKFGWGDGIARFIWDKVELQEDCLLVKCGPHSRECSSFYRPTKRFQIKRTAQNS